MFSLHSQKAAFGFLPALWESSAFPVSEDANHHIHIKDLDSSLIRYLYRDKGEGPMGTG